MATTTESARELPATSHAILGLLTFGQEVSGYDLSKIVGRSIGFFWTPAKSQVYAELRRLSAMGYATEREVAQTDRPDKRLYAITPEGLAAFRRWLETASVEREPIKSTFLLKLFFGHLLPPEAVAAQIREYRRQVQEALDEFTRIESEIPAEHELYSMLTLRYGIAWARGTIGWCDEALKVLTKAQKTKEGDGS